MKMQLGTRTRARRTVIEQRLGHGRTRSVECYTISRTASTPCAPDKKPAVVIAAEGMMRIALVPRAAAEQKSAKKGRRDSARYSFLPLHQHMLGLEQAAMA